MNQITAMAVRNLGGCPAPGDTAPALDIPANWPEGWREALTPDQEALLKIARKISATRRPGAVSKIPAGATYMAQFVAHDLDFLTREGTRERSLLDLGLIYGDGPRNDAHYYQVPKKPGQRRFFLRLNRTRPTPSSPSWGAARDLPRLSCPHLDAAPTDTRADVLVPNTFSDSNLVLGQMQSVWMLLHNAIAGKLVAELEREGDHEAARDAFDTARRINRGIYRSVICADVLRSWLMPHVSRRYRDRGFRPAATETYTATPREFLSGVGRLGHGLVREIYRLNPRRPVEGLRSLIRHTGSGRPHDMPLTEDWLVDFAEFFDLGAGPPQMARALGPHLARPFGVHDGAGVGGVGVEGAPDALVLRDLIACTRGDLRSIRSLAALAREHLPGVLDGWFVEDESAWTEEIRAWLADAGLDADTAAKLAQDPPLTLFLMIEAEKDSDGDHLGALGSFIMAETIAAALPLREGAELDPRRSVVFGSAEPTCMADVIRFLQHHYSFAEGARLYSAPGPAASPKAAPATGGKAMLDQNQAGGPELELIEVADHIEMGRLVIEWATDRGSRPETLDQLKSQLDGIATVPDRIKDFEFCQGTEDKLVLRLPVKEMMERAVDEMSDPERNGGYPMPQFYSDFYRPGFSPVMSPLETLMARVGDYTIAQCK